MKTCRQLFLLTLFCVSYVSHAQELRGNIVKANVLSGLGKTISLEYERAIVNKISVNASFALMPTSALPYKSIFEIFTGNSTILDDTKLGAYSFALEGRYYVNKKPVLQGVYLAPFVKYSSYNAETKVHYVNAKNQDDYMPIDGKINTVAGGIALGVQWVFANRLTVDWRIFGPYFGGANGNMKGEAVLSTQEQKQVRDDMNDFTEKIPLLKFENEINAQGLTSKVTGPWTGARTGLSIGYSF